MVDKVYKDLLFKILNEGKEKIDRTGTGTISIFSHTLEIDMADGFPLLTTKKMFTKGIIHELLWFLNGDTNIQYLVKNGVNIWTPDAYKKYLEYAYNIDEPDFSIHIDDPVGNCVRPMHMDEFKEEIISNDKFAKRFGALGPVYGKQWINWGRGKEVPIHWEYGAPVAFETRGINQIQQALDTLKSNPDSRRIIVNSWNVREIEEMTLPPCHWAFELYTEELTVEERITLLNLKNPDSPIKLEEFEEWFGISREQEMLYLLDENHVPTRRLSLKWHQRSVDTFLGLPFNIASYGLLLEMMAQQVNMVPGMLVGDLTNVHIYKNHVEQCELQISRTQKPLPQLKLCKAKDMFSYKFEDYEIVNYKHHDAIKGKISV